MKLIIWLKIVKNKNKVAIKKGLNMALNPKKNKAHNMAQNLKK